MWIEKSFFLSFPHSEAIIINQGVRSTTRQSHKNNNWFSGICSMQTLYKLGFELESRTYFTVSETRHGCKGSHQFVIR